jgi:hypothetical protein
LVMAWWEQRAWWEITAGDPNRPNVVHGSLTAAVLSAKRVRVHPPSSTATAPAAGSWREVDSSYRALREVKTVWKVRGSRSGGRLVARGGQLVPRPERRGEDWGKKMLTRPDRGGG